MDYGKIEQAQEDYNFKACRTAYIASYPNSPSWRYESCEDGEWECKECPWNKHNQVKESNHGK